MMHNFYKIFEYDPVTLPEKDIDKVYTYQVEQVEQRFNKHQQQGKQHFAILLDEQVIGDIYLKQIDQMTRSCEMGIHLVNDTYKNKGYGTQAEKLLLKYAFEKLGLAIVYANTLLNNDRSKHVLSKVGFKETHSDAQRCYFECRRDTWKCLPPLDNDIIA